MPVVLQDACDENIIRSGPAAAPCSKSRGRWILAATILASSMAFIDGTVVNVALPALQTNFNATATDVQWVIESYALFISALLLVGGSLGDHYGRRRIFLLGVAIFAVASATCGLGENIHQLIAARALQGFGAALLLRAGTRTRNWIVVGLQRNHCRSWPGFRRMADRARFMARRVFHQSSVRTRCDINLPPTRRGKLG
jgi:hypothetical protein